MKEFWSEDILLTSDLTWNESKSSYWKPTNSDLWITLPVTFLFIIVKILWKKLVGIFLPLYLSKFDNKTSRKPVPNLILEKYYIENRRQIINEEKAVKLAKQIGWTSRRVQNWFRLWKNKDLHHAITKFTESSWEFIFYTPAVIYGVYFFSQTNWSYDTDAKWFEDWPKMYVSIDLYYYYVLEFSFYLSSLLLTFLHYDRSDFLVMVIHHVTTLIMMCIAFNLNILRVCALCILVHDVSDPFLHFSKIMLYLKLPRLTRIFFFLFAATFFVSRLIVYPCIIIYTSFTDCPELLAQMKAYQCMQVLMLVLQLMHIVWFYLIMQHFFKYILVGKELRDVRSDGGSEDEIENNIKMNPDNPNQSSNGINGPTADHEGINGPTADHEGINGPTADHEEINGIHQKKDL